MDTYKLKWTRLQAEIFRLLCIKAGASLNLREIARSLEKSPTAVSNALKDLEKEEIVKVKKDRNINLLSIGLNRDNRRVMQLKRAENLKLIYESGLADFLEEKFPGCTIILFGSYSKGDDIWREIESERSDIDIAIIGSKRKDIDLTKFDKLLERTVFLHFYESWNKIDRHLRNNILNGIVLIGGVEL